MEAARLPTGPRRRRSGQSERRLGAAMLSPSLVVIALVAAYPIGYAVWLSLNEYSVRVPGLSRFVGFENYSTALSSPEFWEALRTTFLFTGISVAIELVIGLAMALVMAEAFRGRALLRAVVLVPWAMLTVGHGDHLAHDLRARPRVRQHDAAAHSGCRAATSSGSASSRLRARR